MNSDLLHDIGSFVLVFGICFGGPFVCFLLRSRLLHQQAWLVAIGSAFAFTFLYELVFTTISDLGAAFPRSQRGVAIGIGILFLSLPYLGIAHALFKYRRTNTAATTNAPPPPDQNFSS